MQESPPLGSSTPHPLVVPSRSDALLSTMTEPVGGPLGKRTAPGVIQPGFFTVERVLVLMTAVAALIAVLGKSHCRTSGWTTPDQYSTVCYSAFPNSFVNDMLGTHFPFFSQGSPFGDSVLAGWVAGLTAWLTSWLPAASGDGAPRQLAFFDVNAALIAVLWIITVVIVARTAGRRSWDAAIVATSPVLILMAYVSWDFWAVALAAVAVYLFARSRVVAAGAVLGVAAMAAPYPLVILLALLFLGIRAGRVTKMLEMLAAALVAWLLVLTPVMLVNPPAYPNYLRALLAAKPSESSIYGGYNLVAERMGWVSMDVGVANALATVLLAVLVFGLLTLALYAPIRPRVGQLLFVAAAGFMVLNKGAEPWHAMWLLPLVVLALPQWRPVLLWQAAVVAHFIALMLFRSKILGDIGSQHAIDMPYFLMAAMFSALATCALVGIVIRDMYAPEHDVVARGRMADPQAGVLGSAAVKPAASVDTTSVGTLSSGTPTAGDRHG
ncbi:hypothetical protein ART_2737 [Arthrobacter sp. PAMC 25486]|uniref:hypothetical protein n=1 Tax=Arthrobacter sp. PAMC 25486 TaxID=1494608 RepID=UPI0005359EAF|nr:hypothetical protein [Arthrobacter sp. PAMC 25486]AIY02336.1 hypothetical protein ART_2737 [Arthrobacter sp. PAMC 25486]